MKKTDKCAILKARPSKSTGKGAWSTVASVQLGLVSVSFRPLSPEQILRHAAAAGLTQIEWGSDVHAPYDCPDRVRQIAALQRSSGISCSSYGTYFRLGQTPLQELPCAIEAANRLGTGILRLWCGDKSGAEMSAEERARLLEVCCHAAELAEQSGVTLCMECHAKTWTERPEDAHWLMRTVNSPAFRMYWQPSQWRTQAENCASAALLAADTVHLHVFHWQGRQRYPLHQGVEAWREYLRYFPAPRTLLLEFMPHDSPEELPAEAEALRSLTRSVGDGQ